MAPCQGTSDTHLSPQFSWSQRKVTRRPVDQSVRPEVRRLSVCDSPRRHGGL